ncbi:MAG: PAS domain-containing protein, partial [Pedobacter sp.]|nr:PAS domain-containing protein [Pedobacter sp.]
YRSLFFHNPSPMWIFNPISLVFLQVNEAAVSKYGFSYEEFEKMTIEQIRVESVDLIRDSLHQTYINQSVFSNVALHQKKNGQQFFVKVRCSTIPFEGQEALLVIANDITTEISHNEAIKQQNLKLKSIAYLQSHTIRAPLAKIKGMWTLLDQDRELVFDPEFYAHLRTSVEELDTVIKNIIQDSSIIVPTKDEDHGK